MNTLFDSMCLKDFRDMIDDYMEQYPETANQRVVLVAHPEHLMPVNPEWAIGRSFVYDKNPPEESDRHGPWISLTFQSSLDESDTDQEPVVTLGWGTFDSETFPDEVAEITSQRNK